MTPRRIQTFIALTLFLTGSNVLWAESETPALPRKYDAQGHRDPFTPLVKDGKLVGGKAETALPELGGIMYDPDNPIAMMGDKEVTVGDTIDDYKVVEIRETSVILQDAEGARVEIKQKAF